MLKDRHKELDQMVIWWNLLHTHTSTTTEMMMTPLAPFVAAGHAADRVRNL